MKAIRFDHVSKQFPGVSRPAVDECSFEVEAGQFVTLLGPSGCGKTTLLKMVNRLYEPTGGTIFIDATDVRQLPVTELRRQIGYVIQQTGLFPHLTVAQNIAVVPTLLKWSKEKIAARVDELLALIELAPDEYRARYPAQLSGGQQQRVGLARALAADPGVILMDEPFSAIDAITREALQDEMLRLQRKVRKTILFVTHDVEEALRLADKIVVMRAGKVVQYDTPFNILTRPADPFVGELLGADDIVRRLGLIRVEGAMAPLPPGTRPDGEPTIAADGDLREALSALLRTGAASLIVRQGDRAVGRVALEQIRDAARVRVPA
ncbi:MAG: ABC transporter, ATP-binding protein (cluster 13, osmolytes) [uncultured Thermomicrobiales bacterium]|uniref:ABC transporter, ATP-binding protein (Cluster 13, osmolytes) n=1 Tax=uncultured Thermomicrobiales bacterium TaxID=1645740 RepID=A0A6J4VSI6_9BACT|nr:MAG: ABC transporter, ATP-binding protein (cluster 13, osmolytes) [uncultured Thermomicrobiales bacterium]